MEFTIGNNSEVEIGMSKKIQESSQRLLDYIEKESKTNKDSPKIYITPSYIRDMSPNSFDPQIVSIGPLHKEDKGVQAFEVQKATYVSKLMNRITSSPKEEILESCMQQAYGSMKAVKDSYVCNKDYGDDEMARMMVVDACFVLEFVLEFPESYTRNVFQSRTIMHDLVLLENQIPFFFLEKIFQCTVLKFMPASYTLLKLMGTVLAFHNIFKRDIKLENVSTGNDIHHILSLLHECYKPPPDINLTNSYPSRIGSAVDLDRAGVMFKPNNDQPWVMGMEYKSNRLFGFWGKATLLMPILLVGDCTELVLKNLIAYEQSTKTPNYVTRYAIAIGMLVNTQKDVRKLIESGVLINFMASNKEAASVMNNICKYIPYKASCYEEHWPKNMTWLRSLP